MPTYEEVVAALAQFIPPALPDIPDEQLRKAALTHISALGNVGESDVMSDYRKLAHLGDALLEGFITGMLQDEYPDLEPGAASLLRSNLVTRRTLSAISHHYGLPPRMIASATDKPPLIISIKETCELFESYIGALFYLYRQTSPLSNGGALDKLSTFLYPLFLPLSKLLFYSRMQHRAHQASFPQGGRGVLHAELAKRGMNDANYVDERFWPDWIDKEERKGEQGMMFKSTCEVKLPSGEIKEQGIAINKQEARNIAAHLVLEKLRASNDG